MWSLYFCKSKIRRSKEIYVIRKTVIGGNNMADRVLPGPVDSAACIREAVCVHTKKIFDSCRERD